VAISRIIPSLVEVSKNRDLKMDDMFVSVFVQLAKHGGLHINVFRTMLMTIYSGTSYSN
jgi:hypothetical protein